MGNLFSNPNDQSEPDFKNTAWLVGLKPKSNPMESDNMSTIVDMVITRGKFNPSNMFSDTSSVNYSAESMSPTSLATYSTEFPRHALMSATSPVTYSAQDTRRALLSPTSDEKYSTVRPQEVSDTSSASYATKLMTDNVSVGGKHNDLTDISTGSGFKFLQNLVKTNMNGGCACDKSSDLSDTTVQEMNLTGGSKKKHDKKKLHKEETLDDDEDDEFDDETLEDDDDDEFDDETLDDDDDDSSSSSSSSENDNKMARQKGHRRHTERAKPRKQKKMSTEKKEKKMNKAMKMSKKNRKQNRQYDSTSQSGGEEYKIDAKYFYSSEPSNNIYGYDEASEEYNQFRYRSN